MQQEIEKINENSNQRICTSCGTTNTPLWRRNVARELVCNACGKLNLIQDYT